jgi:outer membrane immunogenic protein
MKYLLLGLIGVLAIAPISAASAKDPPPPSQAEYNWSGFYVGGNIGYAWGNAVNTVSFADPAFPAPISDSHTESGTLSSFIGGGQFGYNWQTLSHVVLGFEADWQDSSQGASSTFVDAFAVFDPRIPGVARDTVTANDDAKISWFGTVRGRVGYAWDSLLLYGTAGVAYGKVKFEGAVKENFSDVIGFTATTPFSVSRVNAGWTAGAGIEGVLTRNWTWRIEYLYLDLGSIASNATPAVPVGTESISAQSRFTDNILRAGLNFQFK